MSRDRIRKGEQNRLRAACPNESIFRALSRQANDAQHILFSLLNIGDVVDPEDKFAAKVQEFLNQTNAAMEELTPQLSKERREFVQAERVKDKWASPSCIDGWMCPDSPTGSCWYEGGDPDSCDYCGHPEERK